MLPRVSRRAATALVLLSACTGGSGSGGEASPEQRVEDVLEQAERLELSAKIRNRLESLIEKDELPYEVTQAEFQEAGPEVQEANLPVGTWWVVQFEDPLETGRDSELSTDDLTLYKPLELYRDSLAPYFDQMDFVVSYILSFQDLRQTAFQIDSFDLRLYLDGDISTKQMSRKITITSL